ncbi:hypothetical protein ACET3Z_008823 [Daucus carota]
MKGLKMIDVSCTAIEKLPDSVTYLKRLIQLNLRFCKKLTKLPEQLGDMKGLKELEAGFSAITRLPDSITQLKELFRLDLYGCKKLRNIPEHIGNLESLRRFGAEHLDAHGTSIKQVPDSIRLLSRLQVLNLGNCKKLEYVPKSIWNLTSVGRLHLEAGDIGFLSLPDSVEKLNKLTTLHLNCNVRLCLPMILRFPCLEKLFLTDEGQILSSAEPLSLSQLLNLRVLALNKCTSLGSSLPALPLNLEGLHLCDHSSLEHLPDLSSLHLLERLDVQRCISLKSISLLPRHLLSLSVEECTSLQDLPDLSMLKELEYLRFTRCSNLKSITLKQSILQGARYYLFTSHLPNREVAEWFDYKSSGHTVSFDVPPSSGSNFLGLAIWLVYTCKPTHVDSTYITAVISNKTESITANCRIHLHPVGGEAESSVQCIRGEKIPVKSGDRVKVSFGSLMYCCFKFKDNDVLVGEVKVKMCGVHVIQD